MGDKWTTSGKWRLKAKQNRSFAARAQSRASLNERTLITGTNTATNDPHSHPRLRKRNGGGKSAEKRAMLLLVWVPDNERKRVEQA
jgi:hypothetical protein